VAGWDTVTGITETQPQRQARSSDSESSLPRAGLPVKHWHTSKPLLAGDCVTEGLRLPCEAEIPEGDTLIFIAQTQVEVFSKSLLSEIPNHDLYL
jgi:hypothetical protein